MLPMQLTNEKLVDRGTKMGLLGAPALSYEEAQKRVGEAYKDQKAWAKSAMLNVAKCGKFSSDRTIQEYVDEIWHLDHVKISM